MSDTIPKTFFNEQYSDEHIDALQIWSSPIPHFIPTLEFPRSNLRIACILSERMYHNLKYEASLLLLNEKNWLETLKYGRPDFILMDSFWSTMTGDWYLSQSLPGRSFDKLIELLSFAKHIGIPTVYWNTEDYLYYDLFLNFSLNFDFIFCSDCRVAEKLSKKKKTVGILEPTFQPALYNPFKNQAHANSFSLNILFDGWADIFRLHSQLKYLTLLKENGLSIIDSNYMLFKSKIAETPDVAENIIGSVGFMDRLMALKYSKINIVDECTILTSTRQTWMSLEVAACRSALFYRGTLLNNNLLLKNIVQEFSCPNELVEASKHLLKNNMLRETQIQKSWRNAHQYHTIAIRLNSICETIEIDHLDHENPLVSVILPTFRIHLVEKCLEQFDRQTYSNKELILVINSSITSHKDITNLIGNRDDVKFYILPSERVEGGCLNFGIMAAKGKHVIKMDDDDYYGDNYVLDMMLHNKSVNADVYGKTNNFFHFEDDNSTYKRKNSNRPQLSIINEHDLVKAHISGNTLSGKASFFRQFRYSDRNMGSTDTNYLYSLKNNPAVYAFYDDFGIIMHRCTDESNHSWRLSNERLKSNMEFVSKGIFSSVLD